MHVPLGTGSVTSDRCDSCGHLRVAHYALSTFKGCSSHGCDCKLPPEPVEWTWPAKAAKEKVPLRLAADEEIPKSAKTCINYAVANEWEIHQAHFMRGCFPVHIDNPALVEDTEVFRLHAQREDLQVAACWVNNSFFLAYAFSFSRKERKQINSRDLWSVLKLELV